jgi:hypothetical protein
MMTLRLNYTLFKKIKNDKTQNKKETKEENMYAFNNNNNNNDNKIKILFLSLKLTFKTI